MDNVFLTGPLGTQWNIGSWIVKDQPIDYGAAGMIRQQLTQTTFVEGAQLAYETSAGARKMSFPLIVPSGGVAGVSLDVLEASLREMVRPGGHVDVQPQGVATAEIVRFDILGGDVAHNPYSVDIQRIARRQLLLTLQTQPFGYWPTAIVLASTASIAAGPFTLAIPKASVIGDVPGFGILQFSPYQPSNFGGGGTWMPDMVAWSLGGKPSFNAFLHPASWSTPIGTVGGDRDAPASQYVGMYLKASDPWQSTNLLGLTYTIPTTLMPAYSGRFRFFAFLKLGPSIPAPWTALADNMPLYAQSGFAATGNPQATVVPPGAATHLTWNNVGSGYQIVDLGEMSIPRFSPSTPAPGQETIRLLLNSGPSWVGSTIPSGAFIQVGGGYLLPLDAPAGILPYGLSQADTVHSQNFGGSFFLNAQTRDNLILRRTDPSDATPLATGMGVALPGNTYYRGLLPFIGATVTQLSGVVGVRQVANGQVDPPAVSPVTRLGVSVSYVPRFMFTHGL